MRALALSILALAAAAPAIPVHAAEQGFYLGAGFGRSEYSDDLGSQIRSAYAGRSDFAVDAASLSDRSDQAWKILFGYRFLPWLSGEIAYTDAGEASSDFRLRAIAPQTSGTAVLRGRYQLNGTSASLVGEWPLSDAFAVSLRAGLVASQLSYDERGTDGAGQPHAFHGPDDNNTGGLAGLGLAWHMAPQWDLRLDWDRWFDVGTRFDVTATENGRFNHVDLYTLNLIYRFGQ